MLEHTKSRLLQCHHSWRQQASLGFNCVTHTHLPQETLSAMKFGREMVPSFCAEQHGVESLNVWCDATTKVSKERRCHGKSCKHFPGLGVCMFLLVLFNYRSAAMLEKHGGMPMELSSEAETQRHHQKEPLQQLQECSSTGVVITHKPPYEATLLR